MRVTHESFSNNLLTFFYKNLVEILLGFFTNSLYSFEKGSTEDVTSVLLWM